MQHLGESLWYGNPASKWIPAVCESSIQVNPWEMEIRHPHEHRPPPLHYMGPRLNQFRMNLASNNKMRTDSKEWRPRSFVNHNKNLVSPRCDLKSVSGLCYLTWDELKTHVQWERMKIQIDFDVLQFAFYPPQPPHHLSWHNLPSKGVIQCPGHFMFKNFISIGCGFCWRFRGTRWEAYSR